MILTQNDLLKLVYNFVIALNIGILKDTPTYLSNILYSKHSVYQNNIML